MRSSSALRQDLDTKNKQKNSHLGLRIKRVYLQAIRDGRQTVELRADTEFYRRMFEKGRRYRSVTFHYQRSERLTCDIESIALIKRPATSDKSILPTENVYAIKLRNPRVWHK